MADALNATAQAAAALAAEAAAAAANKLNPNVFLATGGRTALSHLPTPAFLAPVLRLNTLLLSSQLHGSYFPFPWMFVLHAVRCSFAWRGIIHANTLRLRAKGEPVRGLTWGADVFGFLLMSWGGGILAHFITGQIPPQFLYPGSALTYLPVHAAISLFLSLPSLSSFHPTAALLDVLMPFIDGATRAGAVALGVNLAAAHSPSSLLLQLLLGTLTACGGGQSCGTLGTWNPNGWSLSTPPALAARTVMEGVDVWAPFLAAVGYIVLGGTHEDVLPLTRPTVAALQRFGLIDAKATAVSATGAVSVLSPTAARALATLIITSAFVWRATVLHGQWATASISSLSSGTAASKSGSGSAAKSPASKSRKASGTASNGAASSSSKKAVKAVEAEAEKLISAIGTGVEEDERSTSPSPGPSDQPVRRSRRRKT
ncbi:hypothetical protein OC835_004252 [Tilletia horrida]|nr:hypothetical protein OC835_004252 [Tilletia horrida]